MKQIGVILEPRSPNEIRIAGGINLLSVPEAFSGNFAAGKVLYAKDVSNALQAEVSYVRHDFYWPQVQVALGIGMQTGSGEFSVATESRKIRASLLSFSARTARTTLIPARQLQACLPLRSVAAPKPLQSRVSLPGLRIVSASKLVMLPVLLRPCPMPSANSINSPYEIATDSSNGLCVVDSNNHRVLYFPHATVTDFDAVATIVYGQSGNFTLGGVNNGGITANSLNAPWGVAADANGVYISDRGNNRILFY